MIPLNSYQVRISGNVSPTTTSSKLKEIPKTNEYHPGCAFFFQQTLEVVFGITGGHQSDQVTMCVSFTLDNKKKNRRGKKTSVSLNKNQITCFNPQIVTAKFKYRIGLGFIGTRTKLGTTTQTTVVIYQVTDVYRLAEGEVCQGCTMAEGTTFDAHV